MHLLACSYQNIWPFVDRTLSIDFRSGSHLIQAPIGSGKSFLFFDGPLFGLYKHRGRPMLNKQSKKWKLQVLFELDEQTRLIERSLTPTSKGGESIKTKMREVSSTQWLVTQDSDTLITRDSSHLDTQIGTPYLSEVMFAHTKEADKSIQDLLPPKELILSRNFLLQESSSVFELPAGERVQVFKHLFGLLGIDEAKDSINEKRKELQTIIQVKSDQTQHTTKLRTHIQQIKDLVTTIHSSYTQDTVSIQHTAPDRTSISNKGFFEDLWLLSETVQVQDFSLSEEDYSGLVILESKLADQLTQLSITQGEQAQLATQLQALQTKKASLQSTHTTFTAQLTTLAQQLKSVDTTALKKTQQDITNTQKSLDAIESEIPYDAFVAYGSPLTDISQLQLTIQSLLSEWKQLADTKTHLQSSLESLIAQHTHLQQQITQIQQQKSEVSDSHAQQNKFDCDKIDGPCPYVQLINKNAVWALKKQIQHFAKQEKELESKLAAYDTKAQKKIQDQIASNEAETKKLKEFLSLIWRKNLQTLATQYTQTQQTLQSLQSTYTQLQQAQQALQSQKDQELTLTTQLATLVTQITDTDTQIQALTTKQASIWSTDNANTERSLTTLKTHISQLHRHCESLHLLVTESKQHQLEVKQLNEELVITKDLYQIFSKELMIVVLQDFLPTLEEVINSHLSQIVDYQIKFVTPTDDEQTTQLELDIQIVDSRWARSVKSLSWWQKTILKLVWMLAVATLFKSKFLFLDETINNLDTHTIAQVADVLSEFVVSNEISFYVVTHSPQIQQMDIWDSTVEIGETI